MPKNVGKYLLFLVDRPQWTSRTASTSLMLYSYWIHGKRIHAPAEFDVHSSTTSYYKGLTHTQHHNSTCQGVNCCRYCTLINISVCKSLSASLETKNPRRRNVDPFPCFFCWQLFLGSSDENMPKRVPGMTSNSSTTWNSISPAISEPYIAIFRWVSSKWLRKKISYRASLKIILSQHRLSPTLSASLACSYLQLGLTHTHTQRNQ